MKTKNLVTILLGVIGTLLLGIGMSILMVPEFDAFVPGLIVGAIGLLVLLAIAVIWYKPKKISFSIVFTYIIGIIGIGLLGVSLSQILSETSIALNQLLTGLIYGVPGILICVINPLVYVSIQSKKHIKGAVQNV